MLSEKADGKMCKVSLKIDYSPEVFFPTVSAARKYLRSRTAGQARVFKFESWGAKRIQGRETLGQERCWTIETLD